ncbi:MAG: hypothetical protein NTW87_02270 [Planctomycetota bacterium]|nr:hypothetical protein [Planctomycetota bacterium]
MVPIVKGAEKAEGARILVGESEATRALGLRSADFQPQEFLVRFLPDTLLLLGRDKDDRGPVKYDFSDPLLYETWPDFYDVARELKKTHPDKYIITLAYMTHAAIPRLSTVIVRETRRKAVHSDTTGPSSQETR